MSDPDGASKADHHADETAENRDERIVVEEAGLGIDIIREQYCLVKYEDGERWYDWHRDESFHIRADRVPALLEGIESVDIEHLQESIEGLDEIERAMGGDGL